MFVLLYLSPEKLGPLGYVRDIWLCRRALCLKSQILSTKKQTSSKLQAPNSNEIPNYKHQISNKSQISSLKYQTRAKTIFLFFCLLFVFCYLGFPLLVIVICLRFDV